jgi:hypothetical protein
MPGAQATIPNFSSPAPGAQPAVQGYNAALQNLNGALKLSGDTTSAQQMALGTQLQQQQGQVQQHMTNKGLGNTTVAENMQLAPTYAYNQGMAQLSNMDAMRGMGALGNIANMSAQGGENLAKMDQPYQQSQYGMGLQQALGNQQAIRQGAAGMNGAPGTTGLNSLQPQAQQAAMMGSMMQPQAGGYWQGPTAGQTSSLGGSGGMNTAYSQYLAGGNGGAVADQGSYVGSEVDDNGNPI